MAMIARRGRRGPPAGIGSARDMPPASPSTASAGAARAGTSQNQSIDPCTNQ